jgi:hypothetical protein
MNPQAAAQIGRRGLKQSGDDAHGQKGEAELPEYKLAEPMH